MPSKFLSNVLTISAGFAFLAPIPALGAIAWYDDRSSWRTAAGGGTGGIVDGFDSGTKVSGVATRSGFTISGNGFAAFPNSNSVTAIDGTGYVRMLLIDSSSSVVFTFSSPVYAIGYDLNPQATDLGASVTVVMGGRTTSSYLLPSTDENAFRGMVSSTGITSFTIQATSTSALHGIDNFEAYSSVPEPRSMACVLGAALGLWAMGQRVRRRDAARC